ncbi:unnamed protein product [Bursaphelenchus xylophilus]|uniref:(pine wood nematode) hypothetical protein n=1 Tax=Bursaphelenchus xylophilus TaxID=6326 RepID=A0A1I7S1J4_BURXY|nr:unnamed protein product [Bursaphelenchus xylophilus]CAG9081407.1 unnamed protein product [Bursaphelenchus xylophilus]
MSRASAKSSKSSAETFSHASSGEALDVYRNAEGKLEKTHGMHWLTTGIFLTGELAGAGVIALPLAVRNQGFYYGMVAAVVLLLMCAYTSIILGRSWMILLKHWPAYHSHCKNPYAEIGKRAMGRYMKNFVEIVLNYGMFAVGALLIVIVAKGVGDMIKAFTETNFSYCYNVLIVSLIILPSFYLRSPENFHWIINAGMVCTVVAIILAMIGIVKDAFLCDLGIKEVELTPLRVAGGFGTLFFAYGGHAVFPSVQHDMKKPYLFSRSSNLAYTLVALMYFPLMIAANYVYGDNIQPSIINNINTVWIQQSVNILIFLHCALTVVLVMNPINQQIEHFGGAPPEFSARRVFYRTLVMLAAVFLAESFPNFGPLIDLMGATVFTMTSYIFPIAFYLYLNAIDKIFDEMTKNGEEIPTENGEKTLKIGFYEACKYASSLDLAYCCAIYIVAVLVFFSATTSAIEALSYSQFLTPCYLKFIWPWPVESLTTSALACCGDYHNLSLQHCYSLFD